MHLRIRFDVLPQFDENDVAELERISPYADLVTDLDEEFDDTIESETNGEELARFLHRCGARGSLWIGSEDEWGSYKEYDGDRYVISDEDPLFYQRKNEEKMEIYWSKQREEYALHVYNRYSAFLKELNIPDPKNIEAVKIIFHMDPRVEAEFIKLWK